MKTRAIFLVTALGGSMAWGQEPRTGVSHPDADPVLSSSDAPVPSPAKEQPATVSSPVQGKSETFGPYVPYQGSGSQPASAPSAAVLDPDASVVTSVEEHAGELREGTLLRVRMSQALSTATAEPGTDFTASLTEPVYKEGRVLLPAGALLHGRVTGVHSGHRISGPAMLHLEAKYVDLPDGTRFPVHAILVDTDQTNRSKVDSEGSLVRRDHPKETLAAMGLAVGGATTAGAMIGGGVGALVGAGVGAGAGTIVWLRQDRQANLPAGSVLVFSLSSPMSTEPQVSGRSSARLTSPDAAVVGDPEPVTR